MEHLERRKDDRRHSAERARLVDRALRPRIRDERVLEAMRKVPRHLFVPETIRGASYEDRPLPIGRGQTISQPTMVAIMLEEAQLRGDERVLDIGSGSGYQSALLGELVREVYAIEIVPELVGRARRALQRAGATNVTVIEGDGRNGYEPAAPYDAIFVAAAAREVPQPLVDQLAEGGRLLLPVGHAFGQTLTLVRKRNGRISREQRGLCAFVPLVGGGRS